MKRIVVIILLMGIVTVTKAQNPLDLIERYSIDTASLVSYIKENKLKEWGIDVEDTIKIFFCFHFEDTVIHSKEDYLDGSFLNSLYLTWTSDNPKKGYKDISGMSEEQKENLKLDIGWYSVVDKKGVMLGMGPDLFDGFKIVPYRENLVFLCIDPTRYMFEKKLDILFEIWRRNNGYYWFGINLRENKIYLVVDTRWGAEMFTLEDIINNHLDSYRDGTLYDEVRKRKEQEYRLNSE